MQKPFKVGASIIPGSRAKVVIADDHKLVADACKSLLEPEFAVVGVVTDGLTLLESVSKLMPNIVENLALRQQLVV